MIVPENCLEKFHLLKDQEEEEEERGGRAAQTQTPPTPELFKHYQTPPKKKVKANTAGTFYPSSFSRTYVAAW